jgi:hypothetical protein
VTVPPFFFAVQLPGDERSRPLVTEMAVRALGQAGCDDPAAGELPDQIARAVAGAGGEVNVRFEVQSGALDIRVSAAERTVWHTTQPLPHA